MGVRLKTFLLLTVVVVVSIITYVCWYSTIERRRMEQELLGLAENYSYAFHAEFKSVRNRMLQLALFTANDDRVQSLMVAASSAVTQEGGGKGGVQAATIRQELYQHLQAGVKELSLKFNIVALQFHLRPGALSFLRFHAPGEMGDRLDDVRPMIIVAGDEQQPTTGFEIGHYFAGVRAAAPVFAPSRGGEAKHCVGVVEFGIPIKSLLDGLKANRPWLNAAALMYDTPLHCSMVPEVCAETTDLRTVTTQDGVSMQLNATTSEQVEAFLQRDGFTERLFSHQNFRFETSGRDYNAVVVPLKSFAAEHDGSTSAVGKVVLWQDVSSATAEYKEAVGILIWYGVFLFFVLETGIYLGLSLVSTKLRYELEHQRRLERVRGKALEAASSLGQVEQQPQIQLSRILQDQLNDAVEQLGVELGMFVSAGLADGEYRIVAVSDMLWSTAESNAKYARARNQLMQQGYVSVHLGDNLLLQAIEADTMLVLDHIDSRPDILSMLPQGHPPIANVLLIPIKTANKTLGLLALANCARGFGTREQILAKAYAGAAAMLMHSDLREVERLSAIETARIKEDLFRNLNHELRTPLNVIWGMGKKLSETSLDPRQKHYVGQINIAAAHFSNLIEEVLLLAGLDSAEKASIHCVPLRISALLTSIAAEVEAAAQERGIKVRCRWDENIPPRFDGDSEKISIVLRQLLENAIKFSRDAEVILAAEQVNGSVEMHADNPGVYTLRFSVTDHGIGIAKEQYARIFEPFYQCDTTRMREYEGAGLGLSVARELCTILGSEIHLRSEVGMGSTFSFDLQLRAHTSGEENELLEPAEKETLPRQEGKIVRERGDEGQLLHLLWRLEEPLRHSRPQPCNEIAAKLQLKEWPSAFSTKVDKIMQLLDKYRYAQALEHVQALQIELEEQLKK